MHYVGMDCHIKTLEIAVVNGAGHLIKSDSIPNSVNGFIGFLRSILHLGHSTWKKAHWPPGHWKPAPRFGEKIVITDPKQTTGLALQGERMTNLDPDQSK